MKRTEIALLIVGIIGIVTTVLMFEYMKIAEDQAKVIEGYRKDC